MKKILQLLLIVGGVTFSTAQTTISQTGGASPVSGQGSAACQNQQTGAMSDNSYFRAYTMTSATKIVSVKIGVLAANGNMPLTVNLYKRSAAFPGSHPTGSTLLATTNLTLTSANNLSLVTANFASAVPVASGEIIVAEVKNAATAAGTNYAIGCITGSETGAAYISSTTCGISTPQTISSLNVANANAKIIIDLVANPTASNEIIFTDNFNMYPNPVSDVLNISSVNGQNVNEVTITDLTGKVISTQKDLSSINVSNLSSGTYLITITTPEGKSTSKFIKK